CLPPLPPRPPPPRTLGCPGESQTRAFTQGGYRRSSAVSACGRRGAASCSCRALRGVEQGVAGGAGERFQLGMGVQFLEDVLDMTTNGGKADPEISRNRAVVEALRHQGEDLLLAAGEAVEQAATLVVVTRHLVRSRQQSCELRRGNQHFPFRRAADRVGDGGGGTGLRQGRARAGANRGHDGRLALVGAEEDDRPLWPGLAVATRNG